MNIISQTTMEEMMMMTMVMMKTTPSQDPHPNIPIITSTISPTWKLYENPFYIFHHQDHPPTTTAAAAGDHKQVHRLHLPIPSRKLAASFLDLAFVKPLMEPELARVKSELERERRARKKMESLNRRLARDAAEERRRREELERACEDHRAEATRMRRDMEEERRMLRTAEVIREERVQMKLAEAKIFLEEKLSELRINGGGCVGVGPSSSTSSNVHQKVVIAKSGGGGGEAENPHIKRGIKGFVEFPTVARAIGCRSGKHLGSKLECQKAQLKILLRQKGPVRFSGLIAR